MSDGCRMSELATVVVVALGLVAVSSQVGCMFLEDCPDPGTEKLKYESYQASEVVPEHEMSKLPVDPDEVDAIEIDEEAGIVEMTYTREGDEYVVTWGIAKTAVE